VGARRSTVGRRHKAKQGSQGPTSPPRSKETSTRATKLARAGARIRPDRLEPPLGINNAGVSARLVAAPAGPGERADGHELDASVGKLSRRASWRTGLLLYRSFQGEAPPAPASSMIASAGQQCDPDFGDVMLEKIYSANAPPTARGKARAISCSTCRPCRGNAGQEVAYVDRPTTDFPIPRPHGNTDHGWPPIGHTAIRYGGARRRSRFLTARRVSPALRGQEAPLPSSAARTGAVPTPRGPTILGGERRAPRLQGPQPRSSTDSLRLSRTFPYGREKHPLPMTLRLLGAIFPISHALPRWGEYLNEA